MPHSDVSLVSDHVGLRCLLWTWTGINFTQQHIRFVRPSLCFKHLRLQRTFSSVVSEILVSVPLLHRENKHFSPVISWCRDRKAVIIAHCRLLINFTFWSCSDYGSGIIITQLCSSAHCCSSNHTAWIEADGNNLQPLADGLCSIDPIVLIKVVYRGNAATDDGWLLVIMQQPANITPLIYGVLTQSMKIIHKPGYFYTLKNSPRRLFSSLGECAGGKTERGWEQKRWGDVERAFVCVITDLCPADLQDKVSGHKWQDEN